MPEEEALHEDMDAKEKDSGPQGQDEEGAEQNGANASGTTTSDSGSEPDQGEEGGPGASSQRRPESGAASAPAARVPVSNRHLKGILVLNKRPWMVKLPDGRKVSPSEFERLAGSLRKNWKSSTHVIQPDGKVGANVGLWLDAQGISHRSMVAEAQRPSADVQAPRPASKPDTPGKRIRRAAKPEKHLAELRSLLESYELCTMADIRTGKDLDEGWAVKYTEIRRADAIDMDPHYVAPEGFVPNKAELPSNFTGRNYNSRKRVALAHGISSADIQGWSNGLRNVSANKSKADAQQHSSKRKSAVLKTVSESEEEDVDEEEDEPPAKRTRTASAAQAILSSGAAHQSLPGPHGPASPGLPSQDAGAQALLQLSLLDRQPPAEQEQQALVPKQEPGKAEGGQRQAIMARFRRVQTFVSIVEIDGDTLKRKKIRQYMQSARAGLEELVDMWATGSAMPE